MPKHIQYFKNNKPRAFRQPISLKPQQSHPTDDASIYSGTDPVKISECYTKYLDSFTDKDHHFTYENSDNLIEISSISEFGTEYYDGDSYRTISQVVRKSNENLFIRAYVLDHIRLGALCKKWERYKLVYQIDPSFAEDLLDSEDFEFTPRILEHLPASSFYLDVSHIKNLPYCGIFVNVQPRDNDIAVYAYCYSPANEHEFGHRPSIISFIPKDTQISFSKWLRIPGSANLMLSAKMDNGQKTDWVIGNTKEFDECTTPVRHLLIKLLIYLCCKRPDIEPEKTSQKTVDRAVRLGTSRSSMEDRWSVGARYGQTLRLLQQEPKRTSVSESHGGAHASPIPHVRRSHWQFYWCGKGRQELRLNYVKMSVVNGKETDLFPTITRVTDCEPEGTIGEELIKEYLEKHDISYKREYRVVINDSPRRYDFRIKHNNQIMFIEYDGEQHFRPVQNFGGEPAYIDRIKADEDKNKYCSDNDIPLLRIRYDQKGSLDTILDAFLNKPTVSTLNPLLTNLQYYSVRR